MGGPVTPHVTPTPVSKSPFNSLVFLPASPGVQNQGPVTPHVTPGPVSKQSPKAPFNSPVFLPESPGVENQNHQGPVSES